MPTIIGEAELKQIVKDGVTIQGGDEKCAEGIKYDFRLGKYFLKAGFNSPKSYEELLAVDKAIVEPGEVVFVMTLERIELPMDMTINLYEKRKLSHDGINLLGGRCVDPGYKGILIFGLHNVTSSKFILEPGKKLVGATFLRLSEEEIVYNPTKIPETLETFPDGLLRLIENYKPMNPNYINSKLEELQTKLVEDKNILIKKMDNLELKIEGVEIKVDSRLKTFEEIWAIKFTNCNDTMHDVNERTKKIEMVINKAQVWMKILVWVLGIFTAIGAGVLAGVVQKILGIS